MGKKWTILTNRCGQNERLRFYIVHFYHRSSISRSQIYFTSNYIWGESRNERVVSIQSRTKQLRRNQSTTLEWSKLISAVWAFAFSIVYESEVLSITNFILCYRTLTSSSFSHLESRKVIYKCCIETNLNRVSWQKKASLICIQTSSIWWCDTSNMSVSSIPGIWLQFYGLTLIDKQGSYPCLSYS